MQESQKRSLALAESYPARIKQSRKANRLKRGFGLTLDEHCHLEEFQQFKCAICLRPLERPQVDHNHMTGESRGLVCWHCNNALGKFRDNPEVLLRAAEYLQSPPIRRCFGAPRFGLPGRVSTTLKRRRLLAIKMVESGKVAVESYLVVYPEIVRDLEARTLAKTQRKLRKQKVRALIPAPINSHTRATQK
jgi:hypothetical protein